jgi:hypothetical protein
LALNRKFDVHVFLGTGVAAAENAGFAPGARYSLLVFIRQPKGESGDARLAREGAATAGWKEVALESSRCLPGNAAPGDTTLQAALGDALSDGCAVVAHRQPLAARAAG